MKNMRNLILAALSAALLSAALLVSPALADVNSNYLVQESAPQDLSPVSPAGQTPRLPAPPLGPPLTSGVGVQIATPGDGVSSAVAKPAEMNPIPTAPGKVAQASLIAGAPVVAAVAAVTETPPAPAAVPQMAPPVAAAGPPVSNAKPATAQVQGTAPMAGIVQIPGVAQVPGQVPTQVLAQALPENLVLRPVAPQVFVSTINAPTPPPQPQPYTVLGAPILANQVVHSYCGYVYPGNSILFSGASALRANMDGTVYSHPNFPNRNLFWNHNESRWCYQDSTSSTGWLFVPEGIYIPRPY